MIRLAPLVLFPLLAAGCAGLQRDAFIHEQAGSYVYERPITEVWPFVQGVLTEQGFSFRQYPGQFVLTTEWKEEMANSNIAASFTRYLVEGVQLDAHHCAIRVFRNSMSSGGGPGVVEGPRYIAETRDYATPRQGRAATGASGTRDLQLEWLVMQRAAPEDAGLLAEAAEARFR